MPYERPPTPDNCTITLSQILNDTSRGKGLVNYYNKFSQFHEDQRSILISLIAQHYEEKGIKMSLTTSYQLEKQILERFPTEKLVIYTLPWPHELIINISILIFRNIIELQKEDGFTINFIT